jgi:hypothetical protein
MPIHFEFEITHDQAIAALTEACGVDLDFSLSRILCIGCQTRIWSVDLWSRDGDDRGLFKRHRVIDHLFVAVNSAGIAINQFRRLRLFNEIILEQIAGAQRRLNQQSPANALQSGQPAVEVKAA